MPSGDLFVQIKAVKKQMGKQQQNKRPNGVETGRKNGRGKTSCGSTGQQIKAERPLEKQLGLKKQKKNRALWRCT